MPSVLAKCTQRGGRRGALLDTCDLVFASTTGPGAWTPGPQFPTRTMRGRCKWCVEHRAASAPLLAHWQGCMGHPGPGHGPPVDPRAGQVCCAESGPAPGRASSCRATTGEHAGLARRRLRHATCAFPALALTTVMHAPCLSSHCASGSPARKVASVVVLFERQEWTSSGLRCSRN
jgi:hypothetical protein